MADTTPAGAMPAVADAMSAQTTPVSPAAGTSPAAATSSSATGDSDALGDGGKRALDAERQSAKDWKAKAEASAKELETLRTASLTESEKRDERLTALEREQTTWQTERQDLLLARAVEREAAKLGADPEIATAMIRRSEIEFDAEGAPRNVAALLQALVVAKPGVLTNATRASGSFDQGVRSGAGGGSVFTTSQLEDRSFWNANKAEIMRAVAEGRVREG